MAEQENYRQLFDALMTAVVVLDTDLNVLYLNASAEMLLGISDRHLWGKPIVGCFSRVNDVPDALQLALDESRNVTKRQESWILHNQQEITVDYTISSNPEMGRVLLEIQPVDRLIRISREEAMLSSQAVSRNLVRGLAHEIKNPLGGIRGAAQLLSKELEGQGLEDYTRIIVDETDRLRNLVDRLLGPRTLSSLQKINVHEALEYVASMVLMETTSIRICKDYDPSIPELPADKEQLIQAILNIVKNAMQALEESGVSQREDEIVLRTRIQRRFTIGGKHHPLVVRISIIDNGPGIPEDIVDDIFFPLVTGRASGTGLGLAIAQNLISQHGGLIECSSEMGRTEFSIYLPLEY